MLFMLGPQVSHWGKISRNKVLIFVQMNFDAAPATLVKMF
jgi:hypothetical protein